MCARLHLIRKGAVDARYRERRPRKGGDNYFGTVVEVFEKAELTEIAYVDLSFARRKRR